MSRVSPQLLAALAKTEWSDPGDQILAADACEEHGADDLATLLRAAKLIAGGLLQIEFEDHFLLIPTSAFSEPAFRAYRICKATAQLTIPFGRPT